MPELPDIEAYRAALAPRVVDQVVNDLRVFSPFFVRTVAPALELAAGCRVTEVRRLGKRVVLCLDNECFIVIHLMIAGRLRWLESGRQGPARISLAQFDFPRGRLVVTEAGKKKRASLHVVHGEAALRALDRGGIEVLDADRETFIAAIRRENHALKRALTDPRILSGIGNAYSDEILHAARLSPLLWTAKMSDEQANRLHEAARHVLTDWTDRLREMFRGRFPGAGDITAFRDGFAAHGRFSKPCPTCGTAIQRIRYADKETNYCPRCQTGGRLLADRSLSRLLRDDRPKHVDDLD